MRLLEIRKKILETGVVPWRRGLFLPARFGATVESDPFVIELEIEVRDRRAACAAVSVRRQDAGPVTTRDLRKLPLTHYLALASGAAAMRGAVGEGIVTLEPAVGEMTVERADVQRLGRRRVDDDCLRKTAEVYRNANRAPREAVIEYFRVSASTAARYIAAARARGYLGEAVRPHKKRAPNAAAADTEGVGDKQLLAVDLDPARADGKGRDTEPALRLPSTSSA